MPLSRYGTRWLLPELERRHVPHIVQPETPRSLKLLRALLLVMAVMLALNTRGRLNVVRQYGVSPGISPIVGTAVLAIAGFTFFLACVGAFFLLGVPSKRHWWLTLALPLLTVVNIAAAIVIIPADNIGVGLVLDVYLFNVLLTLALVVLLLKRPVRAYFGISRPATRAKAA
jgi:hypothetical protein